MLIIFLKVASDLLTMGGIMLKPLTDSMSSLMQPMQNCNKQLSQLIYFDSETSGLHIDLRLAIEYEVSEQKIHSPLTGTIAGCTGTAVSYTHLTLPTKA